MLQVKNHLDLIKLHLSRCQDLDVFGVLTSTLVEIAPDLIPEQVRQGYDLSNDKAHHHTNVVAKDLRATLESKPNPAKSTAKRKPEK